MKYNWLLQHITRTEWLCITPQCVDDAFSFSFYITVVIVYNSNDTPVKVLHLFIYKTPERVFMVMNLHKNKESSPPFLGIHQTGNPPRLC